MLQILHDQQQHCNRLVSRLLSSVLQQLPVSSTAMYQPRSKSEDGAASMFGTVNKLMLMPARAVTSLWRQDSSGGGSSPTADASLSLLLLLLHQAPKSDLEGSGFHLAFQVSNHTSPAVFHHLLTSVSAVCHQCVPCRSLLYAHASRNSSQPLVTWVHVSYVDVESECAGTGKQRRDKFRWRYTGEGR